MKKPIRHAPREELLAEIEQLRGQQESSRQLKRTVHDLRVHQKEVSEQTTQLLEVQRALEESRNRYVDLYDFAPIGYLTLNPYGIIFEINLTGAELLGKERGRVQGLPIVGFVEPADRKALLEFLQSARVGKAFASTTELSLKTPTGPRAVQLIAKRLASSERESYLTAVIDITERRRLERERKAADEARVRLQKEREIARASGEAKDQFLAALSHELRTPLTPIVAALTDKELWAALPERQQSAIDVMRRNLDVEVHLIDDLLDVTRIIRNRLTLHKEPVDVHGAIDDVVAMSGHLARMRDVTIQTELDAKETWVLGDPTRLRQVFWNLLSNAIKFSEPGATVRIASYDMDGHLTVTTSDSGIGMNAQRLAELFPANGETPEPIRSSSGLGLGLLICRTVVQAHGGTLTATSEGLGRGSTFEVRLRRITGAAVTKVQLPAVPASAPRSSLRILLVEDHPDTAEMLSMLLRHHGFEVEVAGSVDAALDLAQSSGCDVLVSDVRLPDGSGMDLMRRLRESQFVRGIAMSGFGTQDDVRRSKEAGYDEHLVKPVDVGRLIEAIYKVAERTH